MPTNKPLISSVDGKKRKKILNFSLYIFPTSYQRCFLKVISTWIKNSENYIERILKTFIFFVSYSSCHLHNLYDTNREWPTSGTLRDMPLEICWAIARLWIFFIASLPISSTYLSVRVAYCISFIVCYYVA